MKTTMTLDQNTRDKIKILSAIEKMTMGDFLEKAISYYEHAVAAKKMREAFEEPKNE